MSEKTENAKKVGELHERVKIDAEKCVLQIFPERILDLNKLLAQSKLSRFSDVSTLLNTEDCVEECNERSTKSAGSCSTVDETISKKSEIPCVENLVYINGLFSPKLKQFMADLANIRVWMKLAIPKIEAGNEVQFMVLKKIRYHIGVCQMDAKTSMRSMIVYHQERAFLQLRISKYPLIEDYKNAVIALDEFQWAKMVLYISKVRDGYLKLYDVITKNLDKIKPPAESNTQFLY